MGGAEVQRQSRVPYFDGSGCESIRGKYSYWRTEAHQYGIRDVCGVGCEPAAARGASIDFENGGRTAALSRSRGTAANSTGDAPQVAACGRLTAGVLRPM